MTGQAGGVVVATSDDAFAEQIAQAVAGITHSGAQARLTRMSALGDVSIPGLSPTAVLIIDAQWQDADRANKVVANGSLDEVAAAFDGKPATAALALLNEVKSIWPKADSVSPVVMVCAAGPSLAFTQIALARGADWVWPSRTQFDRFEAVINRLGELKHQGASVDAKPARPRVLVVENSHDDIARLRSTLDEEFELSVVAEDLRSSKGFYVTKGDAEDHLAKHGPFLAAIVDLALSDRDEETAKVEVGTDEAAKASFLGPTGASMARYLPGIELVRTLHDQCPGMPIFLMSNYLKNPAVLPRIKLELGDLFSEITMLFKESGGYRQLREQLLKIK